MKDENGETRRERNERYNTYVPDFIVPDTGAYLWEWFLELNDLIHRSSDGFVYRIPPSEYKCWSELTGNIVNSWEYDILFAMDSEYCKQINAELSAKREKELEKKK